VKNKKLVDINLTRMQIYEILEPVVCIEYLCLTGFSLKQQLCICCCFYYFTVL